ncbi:MAG: DUF5625 family protein [Campylobacteraceae bacterium]|jgi:hypothetical protein|nr:DUF5625 family protein [Campylobacteraceae bacterium]
MSYLKYTSLFSVIFLGLFAIGYTTVSIDVVVTIASFISALIVSNMIIKSNSRVMTFSEIIKYTLCFSIVTAVVMVSVEFIMVTTGLVISSKFQSFYGYIIEFVGLVSLILIFTLISMFLVNRYFENVLQKKSIIKELLKILRNMFLAFVIIYFAWLFLYNHDLPKSASIDLSSAGNIVELRAKVNRKDHFAVLFEFNKDIDKDERVIKNQELGIFLYGSESLKERNSGIIIPIKIVVYKIKNDKKEEILNKIYDSQNGPSLTVSLEQHITDYNDLILDKGEYLVMAETLQDFEFFKDRKVDLVFKEYYVK